MTRACQFADHSPCDTGRVFCSGDSKDDTYTYCRKHYTLVRWLRKHTAPPTHDET